VLELGKDMHLLDLRATSVFTGSAMELLTVDIDNDDLVRMVNEDFIPKKRLLHHEQQMRQARKSPMTIKEYSPRRIQICPLTCLGGKCSWFAFLVSIVIKNFLNCIPFILYHICYPGSIEKLKLLGATYLLLLLYSTHA
jgi:hypothetical protein